MISAEDPYQIDTYLEVADFWAWETDADLVLSYLSAGFALRTGLDPNDFIGRARSQINTRELDTEIWQHHHETLVARRPFSRFRYPLACKDGHVRWFESSGKPAHADDGTFLGYRGVARDVTREEEQRTLLRDTDRESKLQQTLLCHIERVARIGAWRWVIGEQHLSLSDEVSRILGMPLGERIDARAVFETIVPGSRPELQNATRKCIKDYEPYDITLEVFSGDGKNRWVRVIGHPEVIDGRTVRVFGTFQDVTKEHAQELEMQRLAMTDALTGVANRSAFNDRLDEALGKIAASDYRFAVCMIDLDRFKQVNDQYGHEIGDRILARFAADFMSHKGDQWFFARMGGDEFAVLIEAGPQNDGLDDEIARLHAALQHEVEIDEVVFPVSATGGLAVAPGHGQTAKELLRRADLALYEAKRDEVTNFKRYRPRLESHYRQRVVVVRDFRHALEQGQIVPYYQPVVDLQTREFRGMEALARWCHPEKGVLAAGQFREVFDDAKLSIAMTGHLLEHICRDLS